MKFRNLQSVLMKDPVFTFQAGISLLVILFCMFQLIFSPDNSTQSNYMVILGSVLGYWLPSPTKH